MGRMTKNHSLSCAVRTSTQIINADGDTLPLYNAAVPKFSTAPGSTMPVRMFLVLEIDVG